LADVRSGVEADLGGRGLRSILAEGRPEWDVSYGIFDRAVVPLCANESAPNQEIVAAE